MEVFFNYVPIQETGWELKPKEPNTMRYQWWSPMASPFRSPRQTLETIRTRIISIIDAHAP